MQLRTIRIVINISLSREKAIQITCDKYITVKRKGYASGVYQPCKNNMQTIGVSV